MTERHETGIQWTHVPGYRGATWNPTTGCTRVSAGCDHCYAFELHWCGEDERALRLCCVGWVCRACLERIEVGA